MTIFIPVGRAHTPENQNFELPDFGELRYTLRSVWKHLRNIDDVVLIFGTSQLPTWLDTWSVRIDYFADLQNLDYKDRNIHLKTLKAFEGSSDLLFMNDDHFLMQNFDTDLFPSYCAPLTIGEIHDGIRGERPYKTTMQNTIDHIGRGARFYDLHCPMLMERDTYLSAFEGVNMLKRGGYCLKSIYGNQAKIAPLAIGDCKISGLQSEERIREIIAGRPWFSTGANAFGPGMLAVLDELYPKKSIFEK